eukprot:11156141-Lingulodinium_polyedra.AAC.1
MLRQGTTRCKHSLVGHFRTGPPPVACPNPMDGAARNLCPNVSGDPPPNEPLLPRLLPST